MQCLIEIFNSVITEAKYIEMKVDTGYRDTIETIQAKPINIPAFPNNIFYIGPRFSPVDGQLDDRYVCIYEFTTGKVVGYAKTPKLAILDAVDRINRNGGQRGLDAAMRMSDRLN